jgi:hypothetical protein
MPPLLLLLLLGTPTFTFGATCKAGAVRTGVCLQNSMMDVYRNFNASDTSDCCAACAAEPRFCRSWMWYYTEAKGRHDKPGLCFLGRNNTRITKAPRTCDAGVSEVPIPPPLPPPPPPPPAHCDDPRPPTGSKRPPHILHIVADE